MIPLHHEFVISFFHNVQQVKKDEMEQEQKDIHYRQVQLYIFHVQDHLSIRYYVLPKDFQQPNCQKDLNVLHYFQYKHDDGEDHKQAVKRDNHKQHKNQGALIELKE